jgi:hypothetical protein
MQRTIWPTAKNSESSAGETHSVSKGQRYRCSGGCLTEESLQPECGYCSAKRVSKEKAFECSDSSPNQQLPVMVDVWVHGVMKDGAVPDMPGNMQSQVIHREEQL